MSPEFGIARIGTALGDRRLNNIEKFPGQTDANFLEKTVGILHTYSKASGQTAADLCIAAFDDLKTQTPLAANDIGMLIVVSQHTRANIPPLSTLLAGRLGLGPASYCLDLSIGCTGFVQGLHVVKTLMPAHGAKKALLFNVETLSEVLSAQDWNTQYIFSDAATCTLISAEDVFCVPETFNFGTSGNLCLALNALSGELHMDGLEIYKFVTGAVPRSIQTLLESSRLAASVLDFIFFHQASLRTVQKLKESFSGIRAPFDILNYGNTASCSIPFLLKAYRQDIQAGSHGRFVLSSFGSGLSFANCVMRTVK